MQYNEIYSIENENSFLSIRQHKNIKQCYKAFITINGIDKPSVSFIAKNKEILNQRISELLKQFNFE